MKKNNNITEFLRKLFLDKWYYKVAAVVIAVMLWLCLRYLAG